MSKYSPKAQEEVGKTMHEGKSKNRKQAVGVGLGKATREDGKTFKKRRVVKLYGGERRSYVSVQARC